MTSSGSGVNSGSSSETKVATTAGHRLKVPRSVVFFAFFYAYFALEIDVRLLYHCCGLIDNFPSFYRGADFLGGFLSYPGGIMVYLSALLAQSFYYSWLGAAVVTAQAWAICFCTGYTIEAFGGKPWRALRFAGPLLLLATYSQYGFHFPTTFGFLMALGAFCLYRKLTPKSTMTALLVFLAISAGLYVTTGGPYLLFTVLCILYELLPRRRPALAGILLGTGAAFPYVVGVLLYGVWVHDAYLELLPLSWKVTSRDSSQIMAEAIYALYLFLPIAGGLLGLWHLAASARQNRATPRTRKRAKSSSKPGFIRGLYARIAQDQTRGAVGLNLPTAVLLAMTATTLLLYRDPPLRLLFRVDYCARQHEWDRVLEIGRDSPYHYLVCHAVNRALFHTHQLGDQMFSFPQRSEALFLTRQGTEALWQKVDTCMDIGLLNQSENAVNICIETFGERPLLLQRLATIHIAKGNVNVARVILRALEKVPFWTATARDRLSRLENDPNGTEDPEIQQLRRVMLKHDFVGNADTLTLLLTENPANRMAYEYGMASLLLSKNLDDFVNIFNRYHRLNATRLPRHYEEALLLFRVLKKQPLDTPGQTFAKEAKLRLHEFLQALQENRQGNTATKEQLRATLKDQYGDTYYYYFFLGS